MQSEQPVNTQPHHLAGLANNILVHTHTHGMARKDPEPTAADPLPVLSMAVDLRTEAHIAYLGGAETRLTAVSAVCKCTPCVRNARSMDRRELILVQPPGGHPWMAHRECLENALLVADKARASRIEVQLGSVTMEGLRRPQVDALSWLMRQPFVNAMLAQGADTARVVFPLSVLHKDEARAASTLPMAVRFRGGLPTRLTRALPVAGFLTHWACAVQTATDRTEPHWTVKRSDCKSLDLGPHLRDTTPVPVRELLCRRPFALQSDVTVWSWTNGGLHHRLVRVGVDAVTAKYIQDKVDAWDDGGVVQHWVDLDWPRWPGLTHVRRLLEREAERYTEAPPRIAGRETWRSSCVRVDLSGVVHIELGLNTALYEPRLVLVNEAIHFVRAEGRNLLPCELAQPEMDAMKEARTVQ